MQHIRPRDPVLLGLSTQEELDRVVKKIYLANKTAEDKKVSEG
jgi:hypothetical protein